MQPFCDTFTKNQPCNLQLANFFAKIIKVCQYRCNSAEAKRRHELLLCVQPWRKCSLRIPKIDVHELLHKPLFGANYHYQPESLCCYVVTRVSAGGQSCLAHTSAEMWHPANTTAFAKPRCADQAEMGPLICALRAGNREA